MCLTFIYKMFKNIKIYWEINEKVVRKNGSFYVTYLRVMN